MVGRVGFGHGMACLDFELLKLMVKLSDGSIHIHGIIYLPKGLHILMHLL